eukprot:TRINITY_DN6473_c0_g1_i1.p1 TRINITY_DN6473_c0_g1~~TRINITY_DN6473_c0_g1_i1.p1  ORF type:complete len:448 (-),score=50.05 TRINITY_DN6473_c0_g1_i1:4-1347(-)
MLKNLCIWRLISIIYLMGIVQMSFYSWCSLIFSTMGNSTNGTLNFMIALFFKIFQFALYFWFYKVLHQSKGIRNLDILQDSLGDESILHLQEQYCEQVGLIQKQNQDPFDEDQTLNNNTSNNHKQSVQLPNKPEEKKPNKLVQFLKKPISLELLQKFRFLFEEYRPSQRMYSLSTIYKFEIMSFIVVLFHDYASLQVTAIAIISILHILDIVGNKPFHEEIKYILAAFNEIVVAFLVCLLYYMRQVEEAKQDDRLNLGKFLVFACLIQRIGNGIGLFTICAKEFYRFYQEKIKNISMKPEKKEEERLHLVESNLNWLVQKFTKSFEQSVQGIERVKGREQESTDVGFEAKIQPSQVYSQMKNNTQIETNEEAFDSKGRKGHQAIKYQVYNPVSYTHLTLPTKRIVQISVGAGSLKKKTSNADQQRLLYDQKYEPVHTHLTELRHKQH